MQVLEQAITTSLINLVIIVIFGALLVGFGKSWWSGLLAKLKQQVHLLFQVDTIRIEKKIDDHIVKCNEFPNSLIQEKLENMCERIDDHTENTKEGFARIEKRLDHQDITLATLARRRS